MRQLVLLVRHASTDYRPDRLAAWTPGVHLSPDGREEAKALAERLAPLRLAALYSSPLERTRETAEAIAEHHPRLRVAVEDGLAEVRFGSWQGRPYKVLARTALWRKVQLVPSEATFPGGESVLELQRRGVDAVERIRAQHRRGTMVAVSHADTIKAIAAHYLGLHLDLFQRIVIAPASVTAIGFGDGFPRVLRLSDTGSYEEFAPKRGKARR